MRKEYLLKRNDGEIMSEADIKPNKNISMIQFLKLEMPWGLPPLNLHCPFCGNNIRDKDTQEFTPCSHLLFSYLDIVQQFIFQSGDFKEKIRDIDVDKYFDDNEGNNHPIHFILQDAGYRNELFILALEYSGMACGPTGVCEIIGFDYSSLKSDA